MVKELLMRQLNQELMAAAQLAYFAGVVKTPSLKVSFLEFAKEELEHFARVADIICQTGHEPIMEDFQLTLFKDEIEALIMLDAMEDTMIHYYEDLAAIIDEPFKSIIIGELKEEKTHKKRLKKLMGEVKENL
jgi:rubrerythrin